MKIQMTKNFSSVIRTSILLGVSLVSTLQSTPSYAIAGIAGMGIAPGAIELAVGGIALGLGSTYSIVWLAESDKSPCGPNAESLFCDWFSPMAGFTLFTAAMGGLVMLDNDGAYNFQFATLSADQAQSLGVSESQRSAYNSNLDELNAVAQSVFEKVAGDVRTGMSNKETLADSQNAWIVYTSGLDPSVSFVAEKISSAAFAPSKK